MKEPAQVVTDTWTGSTVSGFPHYYLVSRRHTQELFSTPLLSCQLGSDIFFLAYLPRAMQLSVFKLRELSGVPAIHWS